MAVKSHIHELLTRANAHLEAERWAGAAHAIYLGDLQPLFAAARRALAQDGLFAVSVESLEQGTFQPRPSGRYAQSRAYLQALARQNGLTERAFQTFNLRFERDRYLEGGLACFALQRPIAISAPARRSSR